MDNARELSSRLLDLLRREQSAMAEFLIALADFDRKRLWAELGHTSLFCFLHRELRLSTGAAFYRKVAAELIQRFPEVIEPLRDGRLCLTSVAELAKVLKQENRAEVLPRFFHASKQEAKAVAAEISPRQGAPHRMVVTAVAPLLEARQAAGNSAALTTGSSPELAVGQNPLRLDEAPPAHGNAAAPLTRVAPPTPLQLSAPPVVPAPPRTTIEPLSADLRRLHVTVSKRFMAKLEAARDALSHSHPGADAEAVLEAGLDLLIERHAKRNCTRPKAEKRTPSVAVEVNEPLEREAPGEQESSSRYIPSEARERDDSPDGERAASRHIPAQVKRAVWLRDGGRCQFRLENGELCGSTHRPQFDHIRPVALGGEPTVSNIRLTCAPHNMLAARRVFGDALMDRYAPKRRAGALVEMR
jgi:5-methylcytosine-specific restriction endonuclease McrA